MRMATALAPSPVRHQGSPPLGLLAAGFQTPPRHTHSNVGCTVASQSPDTAVKNLVATIDSLQQQQAHAEAARLAAEQATAAAQSDAAALKRQLHAALQRLAALDDEQQAVQSALDDRLVDQAQRSEQLRLVKGRIAALLAELGADASSSGSSSAASEGMGPTQPVERQLQQKQALAAELQGRLRQAGVEDATLAQLCSDSAAHSAVGGSRQAQPQQRAQSGSASRKATWLGAGRGSGLLGSFWRHPTPTS